MLPIPEHSRGLAAEPLHDDHLEHAPGEAAEDVGDVDLVLAAPGVAHAAHPLLGAARHHGQLLVQVDAGHAVLAVLLRHRALDVAMREWCAHACRAHVNYWYCSFLVL